jgi:hypothetical protein
LESIAKNMSTLNSSNLSNQQQTSSISQQNYNQREQSKKAFSAATTLL